MKRPRRGVSDEGRRLMANVPLPKRVLALLLARRVSANYRSKIYGADRPGSSTQQRCRILQHIFDNTPDL
jgi:hypothetical protein